MATAGRNLLVTGGAGFVGSHTCKALSQAGFRPVVIDRMSNSTADAVKWGPLEDDDIGDVGRINKIFETYQPIGLLHFAGRIEANASVRDPETFYIENVAKSATLLEAAVSYGLRRIVFSSSAAVYGEPQVTPIPESHRTRPVNPYGRAKLMVEHILEDLAAAGKVDAVALRYFNAAGADPDGEIGENHDPETHLIPLALETALGLRAEIQIFGEDYPTPDGTCIRDYVHVSDLADAHVKSILRLLDRKQTGFEVFNLGNGIGYSVREVIAAVKQETGVDCPATSAPRRVGDPAVLVADASLAKTELGWSSRFTGIRQQVRHSLAWIDRKLRERDGRGPNHPPNAV